MELFRPISADEYAALEAKEFSGFPPRSAEQPLLTALLSQEGASQIARHMRIDKQTESSTVYVIGFLVEDSYIRQFPVQHADEPDRRALWIPAEETEILNQHLIGKIRVLEQFELNRTASDVFFA